MFTHIEDFMEQLSLWRLEIWLQSFFERLIRMIFGAMTSNRWPIMSNIMFHLAQSMHYLNIILSLEPSPVDLYEINWFENYNLKAENNIEYRHKRNKSWRIHFRWNDKDGWSLYLVKWKTRFQLGRCFCGFSKGIQIWHQLEHQMYLTNVNGSLRDSVHF